MKELAELYPEAFDLGRVLAEKRAVIKSGGANPIMSKSIPLNEERACIDGMKRAMAAILPNSNTKLR